jgi:ATP-binding cassette subfamily B protein
MPDAPTTAAKPTPPPVSLSAYKRILHYAVPYWPKFVFVFVVGVLATSLGLIQPYISKLLIDEALLKRNFHALLVISGTMVVATILSFILNILSSYQYIRASAMVLFDMRLEVYRHLQALSPRFWSRNKMGDVISRMNNDISEVQRVTSDSMLGIFSNIVFLIGSAVIMAALNQKLFWLSLLVLPVSVWSLGKFQKRLADRVRTVRERGSEVGSFLLETLLGVRLVVAFNAQTREVERFRDRNNKFLDAMLKMQVVSFLAGAVPGTLLTTASAALFLYGGKMVIDGEITTGSLVAIMAYHARLLSPIQSLMGMYTSLVSGGVSLQRVCELLDTPAEVVERPGAVAIPQVTGEIECQNVHFRHGSTDVLNGLSFKVAPGTICALLGPSGVGKSTVAELMVRFYDPDGGSILLDGKDLRDYTIHNLRQHVMLLDQAPYLFHSTVRENIIYGKPDATDQEIEAAARAAAIHDRILALPEGYSTLIAERGQTLSAGERQRIALARALLANPAVLILDEPTSALDEANEMAIADTLSQALAGRTAILITHRPALARIATQTILLEPKKRLAAEETRAMVPGPAVSSAQM